MKTSEIEQSGIHLGTHGEKYGNWMSVPAFYLLAKVTDGRLDLQFVRDKF